MDLGDQDVYWKILQLLSENDYKIYCIKHIYKFIKYIIALLGCNKPSSYPLWDEGADATWRKAPWYSADAFYFTPTHEFDR